MVRLWFCFLLTVTVEAFAATPVDGLLRWDGTNFGTPVDWVVGTNAMITNTTVGKGFWNRQTTPTGMFISNDVAPFHNGYVTINGKGYFGSSSNVVWNSMTTPTQYMEWRWSAPFHHASMGYAFKIHGAGASFGSYNDLSLNGQGDFIGMSTLDTFPVNFKVGPETAADQQGGLFQCTNDVWYWVTLDFTNNGLAHLALYETVNWTQMATTNGAFSAADNDRFTIGRIDAHQIFPAGMSMERGDILFDISNATFPLLPLPIVLPSITSQPTAWTNIAGQQFYLLSAAAGDIPLTYQWQQNTNNLGGATLVNYTNANPHVSDSGWYQLVVSNPGGSATSNPVYVSITNPPPTTTSGAFTLSGSATISN